METIDPDGRRVVLDPERWEEHILDPIAGHPEMAPYAAVVMATVARPDERERDPRPDRERFWRQGVGGPARWMFVVVDFGVEPAWIVTAFGRTEGPAGW